VISQRPGRFAAGIMTMINLEKNAKRTKKNYLMQKDLPSQVTRRKEKNAKEKERKRSEIIWKMMMILFYL